MAGSTYALAGVGVRLPVRRLGRRRTSAAKRVVARVAEGIGLLKAAWTQERANFKGEYWDMDDLLVMPKPVQQPHPPLLIAANSDETFPYAASMGLGVIGTTLSQPMPRMIDRLRDFEKAKNTESPYNPQPFHVNISFFVAETREKAHKLMARNWRDEDIVNTVPDATASSIGTSRHSFTSGVGGWATWSFQDALKYSIYDDPGRLHQSNCEILAKTSQGWHSASSNLIVAVA